MTSMKDVAKLAKVGLGTVSRVYSDHPYVSSAAKAKVLAAAEQLNYSPNTVARALRSGRSKTVGLLISDLENPFETKLASVIQHRLESKGFDVLLSITHSNEDDEKRLLKKHLDRGVDGLIIIPCSPASGDIVLKANRSLPVVELMEAYHPQHFSQVICDEEQACEDIVSHLYQQGHRHIAMVTGTKETRSAQVRSSGAKRAAKINKMKNTKLEMYYGSFNPDWGYLACQKILAKKHRPSAIFAAGASISEGVLRALNEANIVIPEQLSMVAYGNASWFDLCNLSTCSLPLEIMAEKSVDILLEQISPSGNIDKKPTRAQISLSATTLLRGSVKNLNL